VVRGLRRCGVGVLSAGGTGIGGVVLRKILVGLDGVFELCIMRTSSLRDAAVL